MKTQVIFGYNAKCRFNKTDYMYVCEHWKKSMNKTIYLNTWTQYTNSECTSLLLNFLNNAFDLESYSVYCPLSEHTLTITRFFFQNKNSLEADIHNIRRTVAIITWWLSCNFMIRAQTFNSTTNIFEILLW